MSLIDDINRDFPFQVTLALDDELTGVLDWLDARLGHGTCMSTCATRRSAIASAILAMHPRSAGASSTSGRRVRETEVLGSHSENRNLMSNDMFPTWPATERIMDTKRNDAAARTAVTRLLKQYFENLRTRLAAGTAQFWGRIEQRLAQKSAAADTEVSPGVMRPPNRQQPVQQQQAKTESGENK